LIEPIRAFAVAKACRSISMPMKRRLSFSAAVPVVV
jgi:hypothetical protein